MQLNWSLTQCSGTLRGMSDLGLNVTQGCREGELVDNDRGIGALFFPQLFYEQLHSRVYKNKSIHLRASLLAAASRKTGSGTRARQHEAALPALPPGSAPSKWQTTAFNHSILFSK